MTVAVGYLSPAACWSNIVNHYRPISEATQSQYHPPVITGNNTTVVAARRLRGLQVLNTAVAARLYQSYINMLLCRASGSPSAEHEQCLYVYTKGHRHYRTPSLRVLCRFMTTQSLIPVSVFVRETAACKYANASIIACYNDRCSYLINHIPADLFTLLNFIHPRWQVAGTISITHI